jgi:DNA-binding response OmpR family regulator
MKVLAVEDDDVLPGILTKEWEQRGCEVHQSSSGDEAFDTHETR